MAKEILMAASAKHKKYMEDDFDLEHYINSQERRAVFKAFREKNQKLINFLTFLIIVFAFVIALLGYNVISRIIESWTTQRLNEKSRNMMINPGSEVQSADISAENSRNQAQDTAYPFMPVNEAAPVLSPSSERPVQEKIANLRKEFQNDDIVGYLNVLDTNVNFAVAQSTDNSYYLTHDLRRGENVAGSAFMDYANHVDALGYNTVIYAHNMRNGTMFHDLRYYSDKKYFEAHHTISLETLYEDTVWEIFSFYVSKTDFNYIALNFPSQEDFYTKLLKVVKDKSSYDTGIEVKPDDQMLTLSTCTNRVDDTRYVVHARRLK